jgi:hypothetical protein
MSVRADPGRVPGDIIIKESILRVSCSADSLLLFDILSITVNCQDVG